MNGHKTLSPAVRAKILRDPRSLFKFCLVFSQLLEISETKGHGTHCLSKVQVGRDCILK